MYTLHIANKNYSSWSLRPWVLMKELGIEFNEQLIVFGDEPTWQAYRRLSPSGKVPCLTDESTTVWDSLAIIEYLAERHEGVWPKDAKARAWARCAAAEMHSGFQSLRDICSMNVGLRIRMNTVSEGLQKDVDRIDSLWSHGLDTYGYYEAIYQQKVVLFFQLIHQRKLRKFNHLSSILNQLTFTSS